MMKNRIALITGGNGDIGRAVCYELIQQGAKVIVASSMSQEEAQEWQQEQHRLGYPVEVVSVDVADYSSCQRMMQTITQQWGDPDILIHAAGTKQDVTLRKMTPDQWRQVLQTDLDSIFNVTKQCLEGMIKKQYGRIISISSVNGQKGQFGQTNYAAAKAGIYGFTKSLALEVAKYNITVNAISPGFVDSLMVRSMPQDIQEKTIASIPLGRLAQPEEIAWAIAFLASERSAYITGTNLSINGGILME